MKYFILKYPRIYYYKVYQKNPVDNDKCSGARYGPNPAKL